MKVKRIFQDRISFLALIVIVTGLIFLFLVDTSINYYHWATDWQGSSHHDHWGIRLESAFFLYLPIAVPFLILSAIMYPFGVWSYVENNPDSSTHSRKWLMLGGLVIPSIFGYNVTTVDVYQYSSLGPLFTPIIAPLYAFDLNTFYPDTGVVFSLFVSYQVWFLGTMTLGLGLWMVLNYYLFKTQYIGYHAFLIPILLSLLFSVLLFGFSFISALMSIGSMPSLYMAVPSFALGMLFIGQNQRNQT